MSRRKQTTSTIRPESMASVVIPVVCDPLLQQTIDYLSSANGLEIIIVQDGEESGPLELRGPVHILRPWHDRRGVGPSRDAGIEAASRDIVILMDAHMRPHGQWLRGMIEPLMAHPNAVICARSGVCSGVREAWPEDVPYYYSGARIRYQTEMGWPLEPGWLRDAAPGTEIPCALGGCYAIRRSRYRSIGYPWRRAIGWGTSEQTLCMVNWLHGGETILADASVDHAYYRKEDPKPFATPERLLTGVWANRYRLIDILPIQSPEKERLLEAVIVHAAHRARAVREALSGIRVDELRETMALAGRTWEEWCARWWTPEERQYVRPRQPPATRAEESSQRPPARRIIRPAGSDDRLRGPRPMQPDPRQWV